MYKNKINLLALAPLVILSFLASANRLYAQTSDVEKQDLIQTKTAEHFEDARRDRPATADDIMKTLKERAELKIKERRKELLKKIKVSFGTIFGIESNPANDALEKGDQYNEQDFSFAWIPTFSKALSANIGYSLANQEYFEQCSLSSTDHVINTSLKYYPFENRKLMLEPGAEYEWLRYPTDAPSDTTQLKSYLKFTNYLNRAWNYGGKYEHSHKTYYKKAARDSAQSDLDFHREDYRNTLELWVKRNISKYSIKLKGKTYRNNSNDEYQKYYDYDAYNGAITLSGTFLADDKLYASFTPSYERKNYHRRVAVDTARYDNILDYRLDLYYTLPKNWTLNYSFTRKHSVSNAASGEFTNVTNQIGLTYDF